MYRFKKIVIVDKTWLRPWAIRELQKYTEQPIRVFDTPPENDQEIIERIGEADCVLVSKATFLGESVLKQGKNLKYVGMCCSLYSKASANVDIDSAEQQNIMVKGIRDYGDEGVVEFIVSEVIRLLKGTGDHQWREEPRELTGQKIGIIGLGTTGMMVAKIFQNFGSDIYYFSRTRKPSVENEGICYLPLHELLQITEIVSLHLPRNTFLLGHKEFEIFGNGKILINTSVGLTFDHSAFQKWIQGEGNYAIFDADGIGAYQAEFSAFNNIISSNKIAGWTMEAQDRLSQKVIANVRDYCASH